MTYDGSTKTIYLNGSSVASTLNNSGNVHYDGSGTHFIGSSKGSEEFWNGKIDDVAIWQRTLSSSEVSNLYNSGNGAIVTNSANSLTNSLISYWNFDTGSGTNVTDWQSGNDGTIVSGTWTSE